MKNILAVGAFERDNFGDLLFLLILKEVIEPKASIVASSPFYSDMTNLLGEIVYPYTVIKDQNIWDVMWVVGGEVGGCSLEGAANMSIGNKGVVVDQDFLKYCSGSDVLSVAQGVYIPNIKNIKKVIINSVGLSANDRTGFEEQLVSNQEIVIKRADFISVREPESHTYARRVNPKAVIAPDVVHAISLIDYDVSYRPFSRGTRYISLQMNRAFIAKFGIKTVIKMVKDMKSSSGIDKIAIFAAGTALGHDDIDQYLDIANSLQGVKVVEDRDPIKIVSIIANSDLSISTSLHVRIVACSYGVRRVSLENEKVARYASYWDEIQPFDIIPKRIISAVNDAYSTSESDIKGKKLELESASMLNLKKAVKVCSL